MLKIMKILTSTISILKDCLDLMFPRFCAACDERLQADEHYICKKCLKSMPRIKDLDFKGDTIEKKFWGQVPIVKANALFSYEGDSVQHLIHLFKYNDKPGLAVEMGHILVREFLKEQNTADIFNGVNAIIPVPLHKNRFKTRGYNQSERIARGISDETGIPVWNDVVVRIVDTPTQTKKRADERIANVQDAFRCIHPERLINRHIMIVDDVITMGSTVCSLCHSILAALGEDPDDIHYVGTSQVKISVVAIASPLS